MVQPLLELHLGIYDLGVRLVLGDLRLVWRLSLLIYLLHLLAGIGLDGMGTYGLSLLSLLSSLLLLCDVGALLLCPCVVSRNSNGSIRPTAWHRYCIDSLCR